MHTDYILLPVILSLFDGDSGAAPAAGPAEGQGEINSAAGGDASRGRTGEKAVQPEIRYGKQPDQAAGNQVQQADAASDMETLRSEFRELVNGKYKDAYTAETQRIINERFKQTKALESQLEAMRPLIDLLMERHGITDNDPAKLYDAVAANDPTLEERAEENGMTLEQQRRMDALERENARMRRAEEQRVLDMRARDSTNRWMAEAAQMEQSGQYPGFDLRIEAKNPDFMRLLRAGVPVAQAYVALHGQEMLLGVQQQTAAATEKRVVDNIRAKGARPKENGTAAQGNFITKSDPRTLTKADRANIRERVSRGERIVF